MTYNVLLSECFQRNIEVDAKDAREAHNKALDMFQNKEIILNDSDSCGKEVFVEKK